MQLMMQMGSVPEERWEKFWSQMVVQAIGSNKPQVYGKNRRDSELFTICKAT